MLADSIQNQKQEDSVKKGKILFIVLFITLSFFFNKTLGPFYPFLDNSLVIALIYAVISCWGFLWILSFKVNARILLLILPQVVLLIFSQILFLDMFFDQAVGRLYETLLMIVLLIVFFAVTHITFITSNVFAVSSFKKIPLEAVAKTSIYIISSLSIFFATYGFLNLNIPVIFSVIFLLIYIFFMLFFLFSRFFLEVSTAFNNSLLIFWSVLLVVLGSVFMSSNTEFVGLIVTMVFYFGAGLFINKREQISNIKIVEYLIILFLIIFFAYYFSFF